jgi:hypothetical protein
LTVFHEGGVMTIRIKLDESALNRELSTSSGMVGRGLFKLATRVEAEAKRRAPVDTGRLRSSLKKRVVSSGGKIVAEVSTNVKYAVYVHEGTGIYGPRRRLITPQRGAVLVFTPRGAARPVFVRSVRGVKPRPFLRDALRAVLR